MKATLQIVPVDGGTGGPSYQLSIAEKGARSGAMAGSRFPALGDVVKALRGTGLDAASVRFAEKTLRGGLTFTLPGVEVSDRDLRELGIRQMQRQPERGRER